MSVSDADMFRAAAPSQQRPSAATLRKVLPPLLDSQLFLLAPTARHLLATLQCHLRLCSAVPAQADEERLGNQGRTYRFVLSKAC